MGWFGRDRDERRAPAAVPHAVEDRSDTPEALRETVRHTVQFVNRNAGRLPLVAVVGARRLTDTLGEVIDTATVRPLNVYALMSVKGTLNDYLPTTLKAYLAVDDDLLEVARGGGSTPTQSLLEQLDALQTAMSKTLEAARREDADALMTQGHFLTTKFSRSDLEL